MTHFSHFNLKVKFILEDAEKKQIEDKYLELQKSSRNGNDGVINLHSASINEAYTVLKDDIKRANYILKLLKVDLENYTMPQDLIEYIIDVRDDLSDSEEEEEIKNKIADIELELEEARQLFEESIVRAQEKEIKSEAVKKEVALCFMRFKCLHEIIKKYKKNSSLSGNALNSL
jgi:molecular chaperone HscB